MKDTLYLPLKSKWYNMIESGIKKDEYREKKPYWAKRLIDRNYKYVTFSYGYTQRRMTFKYEGYELGLGKKEWGAPDEEVFIIHFGERLN